MVYAYLRERFSNEDRSLSFNFNLDDVFVVWFCYILKNWKALVSTNIPDGMYYEVTFDNEKQQVYIDSYKKIDNKAFNKGYQGR